MLMHCLAVGTGGFIGSVLRYLFGMIPFLQKGPLPFATLTINVLGAVFIGFIVSAATPRDWMTENMLLLFKVGICGGFTTFSTFALETTDLLRSGKFCMAAAYVALSAVCSVAAVFLAQQLVR